MTTISIHPDVIDAAASLRAVADRIEQPGAWTQFAAARNSAGERVGPLDDRACAWCLTGALELETEPFARKPYIYSLATRALRYAIGGPDHQRTDIPNWNDSAGNNGRYAARAAREAAQHLESLPQYY